MQSTRKLTKNITVSYQNTEFQLVGCGKGYRLQHKTINICEHFDGEIKLYFEGKKIKYKSVIKGKAPKIATRKELDSILTNIKNVK